MKWKRWLCASSIAVMLLGLTVPSSAAPTCRSPVGQTCTSIRVLVDGNEVVWNDNGQSQPIIANNTTYVPLRAAAEAMRLDVEYEQEYGVETVTLYGPSGHAAYGQGNIALTVGSPEVVVTWTRHSGTPVFGGYVDTFVLPVPVMKNVNNRVMVPIRYVAEAAGYNVAWDGDTKTIYISDSQPGSLGYPQPESLPFERALPVLHGRKSFVGGRFVPPPSDTWYGVTPAMVASYENSLNQTNDAFRDIRSWAQDTRNNVQFDIGLNGEATVRLGPNGEAYGIIKQDEAIWRITRMDDLRAIAKSVNDEATRNGVIIGAVGVSGAISSILTKTAGASAAKLLGPVAKIAVGTLTGAAAYLVGEDLTGASGKLQKCYEQTDARLKDWNRQPGEDWPLNAYVAEIRVVHNGITSDLTGFTTSCTPLVPKV